eukprot:1800827-Rhodomonas_salina.1
MLDSVIDAIVSVDGGVHADRLKVVSADGAHASIIWQAGDSSPAIVSARAQIRKSTAKTVKDMKDKHSFSALIQQIGYKPTAQVALGIMNKVELMQHMRSDQSKKFNIPPSLKTVYKGQEEKACVPGATVRADEKQSALAGQMNSAAVAHQGSAATGFEPHTHE